MPKRLIKILLSKEHPELELLSNCQEHNEVIDVRDMNNNEFIALLKQISDDVCLVVKDLIQLKKN